MYPADFGGIAAADAICREKAASANNGEGLGGLGTWVAWLSMDTIDARDRILDIPYYRVDGELVGRKFVDAAETRGSFTDCDKDLFEAMQLDQNGNVAPGTDNVWTGTDCTGVRDTAVSAGTCENWTSMVSGPGIRVTVGTLNNGNASWTDRKGAFSCGQDYHFDCFEVPIACGTAGAPCCGAAGCDNGLTCESGDCVAAID